MRYLQRMTKHSQNMKGLYHYIMTHNAILTSILHLYYIYITSVYHASEQQCTNIKERAGSLCTDFLLIYFFLLLAATLL